MINNTFSVKLANGNVLRGIVCCPTRNQNIKRGVMILGAGVNPRYGWHRLSVKIAKILSREGFYTLRVDPQGVGDSDGEIIGIDQKKLEAFHDAVQTGFFIEDCTAALSRFIEDYKIEDIFIVGLCGGALTALYLTDIFRKIKSIIYIAGPVTLTSLDVALPVHPAYTRGMLKGYLKKIVNPVAWFRFVFGKSDYKLIFYLIKLKIYKMLGIEKNIIDAYASVKGQDIQDKEDTVRENNHLNPKVPEAFLKFMERKGTILFINAEIDPATWGFYNLFAPHYLIEGKSYNDNFKIIDIARSNHTFSSVEAQQMLLNNIREWMVQYI